MKTPELKAIADNNERVKTIIADTEALVANLQQKMQQKRDNDVALALFKALGWTDNKK